MPSVPQIDNLMKAWSADRAAKFNEPDYFNEVWKQLEVYGSGHFRQSALNFEQVLGEMAVLTNWLRPAPFGDALKALSGAPGLPPSLRFNKEEGYYPSLSIDYNLKDLMVRLAEHMRALSRAADLASPSFCSYRALLTRISDFFDLGVINLNYDTLALNALPNAFSGFGDDGRLDAQRVHGPHWNFIYHLHGSVHHSLRPLLEKRSNGTIT